MNPDATVEEVLEGYAERWGIEVCFRNLKQLLGFADSCARKAQAVERTAPFVGLIYTTLVLWYAQCARNTPAAAFPIRPWYRGKAGPSFADVLRTAQRVLATADILDPGCVLGNLQETPHASATPRSTRAAATG